MKPVYDSDTLRHYRKSRVSTKVRDVDGNFRLWTSQSEVAEAIGVELRTLERWESEGLPKKWAYAVPCADFLGVEPSDFLSRTSRQFYQALLIRYEEVLARGDTLEVARLSRQVLMWENFFTTGSFVEPLDPAEEAAERAKTKEIEADVHAILSESD